MQTLFSDMAPQQANFWTSQLLPQSLGVFWSRTTYAAWRHIPTTYCLCGQDQNVTVEYAEMMIQAAKDSGPHKIDYVERCEEAGHEVFLSRISVCQSSFMVRPQSLRRRWYQSTRLVFMSIVSILKMLSGDSLHLSWFFIEHLQASNDGSKVQISEVITDSCLPCLVDSRHATPSRRWTNLEVPK